MSEQITTNSGSEKYEEYRVLELAVRMGEILLQSGAEIFRVEDTMRRVCHHFQVDSGSFFVMANGIMSSIGNGDEPSYAKVKYLPVKGARLDKVIAINQLSREIAEGKYSDLAEVERRVQEIQNMPAYADWVMFLSSAIASAAFCFLFGGTAADAANAFIAGFVLYVFLLRISGSHMSKIVSNICGGSIVTACCIAIYQLGLGENLSPMISGAIIPLVPGVAFTNGIRDIGDGDYLSGTVRLLDAIFGFLCIAIGVGAVFGLYQRITGGAIL
ncbi:MAG: threonine/serine exporter family protein [Oscillospiraceae bacterium]|nr:threonine/serine exporter family protein [Oscillospiraceae bacterium]